MPFWNRKKSPLDPEVEAWLLDCWHWLRAELAVPGEAWPPPLVLPTADFFPPTEAEGPARAEHIFRCVQELTGTANWPFVLASQVESLDPILSPLARVQNAPSDPLGTFAVTEQRELRITYDPALLKQPHGLIATFVHEIAHALIMNSGEKPPGEAPELEECATDLATVFLGFGVFGANAAFTFQQFSDVGGGAQGWSIKSAGYLTLAEWAFGLALFLHMTEQPAEVLSDWLKPDLKTLVRQSLKYLDANPELVVFDRQQ